MRSSSLAEITKANLEKSPKGCNCTFIPINDKWGLKLYMFEDTRDTNYKYQKLAAQHGLGPNVGGIINLPPVEGFQYGYISERVETFCDGNKCFSMRQFCDEWEEQWSDEIQDLDDRMVEILGISCLADAHPGNFGMKEGRLVCIDFDEHFRDEE